MLCIYFHSITSCSECLSHILVDRAEKESNSFFPLPSSAEIKEGKRIFCFHISPSDLSWLNRMHFSTRILCKSCCNWSAKVSQDEPLSFLKAFPYECWCFIVPSICLGQVFFSASSLLVELEKAQCFHCPYGLLVNGL